MAYITWHTHTHTEQLADIDPINYQVSRGCTSVAVIHMNAAQRSVGQSSAVLQLSLETSWWDSPCGAATPAAAGRSTPQSPTERIRQTWIEPRRLPWANIESSPVSDPFRIKNAYQSGPKLVQPGRKCKRPVTTQNLPIYGAQRFRSNISPSTLHLLHFAMVVDSN